MKADPGWGSIPRAEASPAWMAARRLLAGGPVDAAWAGDDAVLALAAKTHLGPMLDRLLEDRMEDLAPSARRTLALRLLATRQRRTAYERAFVSVVAELERAGIEHLILKGIANESRYYRPRERRMTDIDIVVHPRHFDQLGEVIRIIAPTQPSADVAVRALRSGALDSVELDHRGTGVDLHVTVFKSPLPARTDDLAWTDRRRVVGPDGAV